MDDDQVTQPGGSDTEPMSDHTIENGDDLDEEMEMVEARETVELIEAFSAANQAENSAGAAEHLLQLAVRFESEENDFRATNPDLFSRERESFPIWMMLRVTSHHESYMQDLFTLINQRRDAVLQAAAGRALVAAAPGLACMPSLQQSLFMEFLTQDSMEEQLFQWVDEPVLPMCCFASGLLAFALLDDHCADEAVRRGLVPKLLRRLRGIVFEDQTVIGAPGAKEQGGGDQELTGKDLLRRERGYVLQCLCVLMSYKECLACALQEGALDVILAMIAGPDSNDVECHDALRMLAALLSHRKFALVFIEAGGVDRLMPLPKIRYYASSVALCLLSMACFKGVMDKLCRLASPTPDALTEFALSCLELGDEVSSCNILQFFSKVLGYETFLRPFDQRKGVHAVLKVARATIDSAPGAGSRGIAKNVAKYCACALRNYLRAHLLLAADAISIRDGITGGGAAAGGGGGDVAQPPVVAVKKHVSVNCDGEDQVADGCISIERRGRFHDLSTWTTAISEIVSHDGLNILSELLTLSSPLRLPDMAVFALNAMQVICLLPVVRVQLAEQILSDDTDTATSHKTGMRVLVDAAGGTLVPDGHVICGALHVLCTCIGCSPPPMTARALQRAVQSAGQRANTHDAQIVWGSVFGDSSPPNAACRRIWSLLQECDGIRVLSALTRGSDYSCADAIRALACRALLGLSHDPRILQILQETQLALALTELVKHEQRVRTTVRDVEAAAFRLVATRLISRVTGRAQHTVLGVAGDSALRMMEKAAMVEQAAIDYDKKELLRMIHSHLAANGLDKAAAVLQAEAQLDSEGPYLPLTPRPTPYKSSVTSSQQVATAGASSQNTAAATQYSVISTTTPGKGAAKERGGGGEGGGKAVKTLRIGDASIVGSSSKDGVALPSSGATPVHHGVGGTPSIAEKTPVHHGVSGAPSVAFNTPAMAYTPADRITFSKGSIGMMSENWTPQAGLSSKDMRGAYGGDSKQPNTLDNIVKTYLRQLHSESRNPIRVLPPLSLANANRGPWHQGPGLGPPQYPAAARANVTCRILGRECGWGGHRELRNGGSGGGAMMRQFVYSRFKPFPWRFSDSPDPSASTAALTAGAFWSVNSSWPSLVVGTKKGTLCRFNFEVPMPIWEVQVHDEAVTEVKVGVLSGGTSQRVLTSSEKEARIWEVDGDGAVHENPMVIVPECANASFNHSVDRIVGTGGQGTTLVCDAETGSVICSLQEHGHAGMNFPSRALRHRRPCFSPDDSMILSDGVLWDPRVTSAYVHKFDRFASYGGGSFHPSRPEVIISAAVWDIRTNFKLLRWCPSLDQMHTVFSPSGHVMYGFLKYFEESAAAGSRKHVRKYKHMFRTVDAVTYTDIATVEIKDNVADLIVDNKDDVIALMETSKDGFGGYSGTTCRLYEVGRVRASRSDDEDEDEDEDVEQESDEEERDEDGNPLGGLLNGGGGQGLAALTGLLEGSDMSEYDDEDDSGDDEEDYGESGDEMEEDEFEDGIEGNENEDQP